VAKQRKKAGPKKKPRTRALGARAREGSRKRPKPATPAKSPPPPASPEPPAKPEAWTGSTQAREGPIPRGGFSALARSIAKEITDAPQRATPAVIETFRDALAFGGSIARACVAAGINRSAYYQWRDKSELLRDAARDIELAWVEEIKSTWVRIAAYGDAEPVRDMFGNIVGERIRRYEPSAMFLLERRLRDQFASEAERAIAAKRQAEEERTLPLGEEARIERIIIMGGTNIIGILPPGLQEEAQRVAAKLGAQAPQRPPA